MSRSMPSSFEEIERPLLEWFGLAPRMPRSALGRQRVRQGRSQGELAREVGVSRQTISSIERGASVPSVRLALALADALGTTVEALFDEEAG